MIAKELLLPLEALQVYLFKICEHIPYSKMLKFGAGEFA